MKYIFVVCLLAFFSTAAFAELIQCESKTADGMTYILASSSTSTLGIIIAQNNAKDGVETIITTKAQTGNYKGAISWVTPQPKIDWSLPTTKTTCSIYTGVTTTFVIDDSLGQLAQGKVASGLLRRRTNFAHNPNMARCDVPEAFPAPPTQLSCHAI